MSPAIPWFYCCICLGMLIGPAVHADAQSGVEIDWRAPAACPSEAEVQRRAQQLAGAAARESTVSARARVTEAPPQTYSLELTIQAGQLSAARSLTSVDCAALAEAAAWLVALTVDPSLGQRQPPTDAPPEALAAAGESRPVEREAPNRSSAPGTGPSTLRPRGDRARAGVFGGLASQGLPGPTGLLGARLGLGRGWSYSELRFAHLFERVDDDASGTKPRFASQILTLSQCAEVELPVSVAACLSVHGERTHGRAAGAPRQQENTSYWLLAGAAIQGFYVLRPSVELGANLAMGLPVTARPRFTLDSRSVGQPSFLSLEASVSLGLRY